MRTFLILRSAVLQVSFTAALTFPHNANAQTTGTEPASAQDLLRNARASALFDSASRVRIDGNVEVGNLVYEFTLERQRGGDFSFSMGVPDTPFVSQGALDSIVWRIGPGGKAELLSSVQAAAIRTMRTFGVALPVLGDSLHSSGRAQFAGLRCAVVEQKAAPSTRLLLYFRESDGMLAGYARYFSSDAANKRETQLSDYVTFAHGPFPTRIEQRNGAVTTIWHVQKVSYFDNEARPLVLPAPVARLVSRPKPA